MTNNEQERCAASPHFNAENFVRLFKAAHAVRVYQKRYFRDRDGNSLTLAKRAERELDALIDEFQNPPQPKQEELF